MTASLPGAPGGYQGRGVLVAGTGVAGAASARALLAAGAAVTVLDRVDSPAMAELAAAGATPVVAAQPDTALMTRLLDGVTDVVVSPGFPPHHPVAAAAVAAGRDVYSEPELAWRMRGAAPAPWLAVTGTNGKTTTVTMLAEILRAAGRRTDALGNIGVPLVTATTAAAGDYDALVVELSSFQLHWSRRMAPHYAAILNLAADHLEWHGDLAAYTTAKTAIWRSLVAGGVAGGSLDDPAVAAGLAAAGTAAVQVATGEAAALAGVVAGRTVGWTLGEPAPGQLGVVDGVLVDRAFGDGEPVELIEAAKVRPPGEHNVANALAAAVLARAYGVGADAVAAGLAGYRPQPHRNASVATVAGVAYVDDSKATNPHAALASLRAYPRVVWVAGGQLKGVGVDDMVAEVAGRLAGVVLLGVDRERIARAVAAHAPGIPVVDVASTAEEAMVEAVAAAARLARPGDTVLLAPAAASLDMYPSYARRGEVFARAVRELAG